MKKLIITFLLMSSYFSFAQEEPRFHHESELGYLNVSGNSDQNVVNFKTTNSSPISDFLLKYGGHYTYGFANEVLNTENWDVNVRLERIISDRFFIYLTEIVEGNKFAGFDYRSKTELGGGYKIIQGEKGTLDGEVSIIYMYEKDIPDTILKNVLGRLYGLYNYKFNENASFKWWAEYLPNFTNSKDYFANTEASVTANINVIFALKFAYLYKYRGDPPENKLRWDGQASMSIIAKI